MQDVGHLSLLVLTAPAVAGLVSFTEEGLRYVFHGAMGHLTEGWAWYPAPELRGPTFGP